MHQPQAGERRERKDVIRNLERVLRAAHELFAERGNEVTMEEVARRAGVGVGTVYRRFASKEQLFIAVKEAACADTHQCLQQAAQQELDAVNKLRALVRAHYQRIAQWAALLDVRADPATGPNYRPGVEQHFYATLHTMLQQVIGEGQRAGVMGRGDPVVLAAICLELLHPRAFENIQRVVGGSADDVADQVARFLIGGLGGNERRTH